MASEQEVATWRTKGADWESNHKWQDRTLCLAHLTQTCITVQTATVQPQLTVCQGVVHRSGRSTLDSIQIAEYLHLHYTSGSTA